MEHSVGLLKKALLVISAVLVIYVVSVYSIDFTCTAILSATPVST